MFDFVKDTSSFSVLNMDKHWSFRGLRTYPRISRTLPNPDGPYTELMSPGSFQFHKNLEPDLTNYRFIKTTLMEKIGQNWNVFEYLLMEWKSYIYIADNAMIYDFPSTPSTNIHWNFYFRRFFSNSAVLLKTLPFETLTSQNNTEFKFAEGLPSWCANSNSSRSRVIKLQGKSELSNKLHFSHIWQKVSSTKPVFKSLVGQA